MLDCHRFHYWELSLRQAQKLQYCTLGECRSICLLFSLCIMWSAQNWLVISPDRQMTGSPDRQRVAHVVSNTCSYWNKCKSVAQSNWKIVVLEFEIISYIYIYMFNMFYFKLHLVFGHEVKAHFMAISGKWGRVWNCNQEGKGYILILLQLVIGP